LLTTTMVNMEKIVKTLKDNNPEQIIFVGGAPVSQEYCEKINADYYSPDPQGAIEIANRLMTA